MMFSSWIARVLRLPSRPSRRQRRVSRHGTPRAFRPSLEMLEDRVVLSVLTVNTTADDPTTPIAGQTTLRDAINQANAAPGSTIDFNICTTDPGYNNGVWTIQPAAALPTITAPVLIDGTSQPGYNGTPVVVLSGVNAGCSAAGLDVAGGNSTVKGLVINQFGGDGIDLTTNGGDVIEGDYIGTNAAGTCAAGNGGYGGFVSGAGNNSIAGDLIAYNTKAGIAVAGPACTENSIVSDAINYNSGGGINNCGGTVSVSDCALSGNATASHGGGIYNDGTLTVSNSIFTNNSSGDGDDIYNSGTLTVSYGTGGFNGTLVLGNAANGTAAFTDDGDFTGNLTVNNPGNLQSLSESGTITAGSSITVLGALSDSTIGTNSGTVSACSISGMTVTTNSSGGSILAKAPITGLSVTENDGTISLAGQGRASKVGIGTNAGKFLVGQAGAPDAGTISCATIGTNSGTVSAGSISSMKVTINSKGGSILAGSASGLSIAENDGGVRIVGQSTATNTSIGTNNGSFVVGSGTDQGTTTNTTIGTNNGTFSTGSGTSTTISSNSTTGSVSMGSSSGMSVTTNSGGISIVGQSTADNTSIGTNNGSFVVGSGTDQGTTTNTTIGTNNGSISTGSGTSTTISSNSSTGSVSMGSSSGMTVTTNSGGISIVGQSTADNTSIGTNNGSFVVGSGTDQGTTTNTSIGTNNGTFSTGSGTSTTISSNSSTGSVSMGSSSGMTVTTNSGGISIVGQSTADNTSIGTNNGSFVVGSGTDQGTTTNTSIGTNNGSFSTGSGTSTTISSNSAAGSVSMGSSSGMTVTTNSGGISIVGASKADNTSIGTNNGSVVVGSATDLGSATNTTIGTLGTKGTFKATGTITNLNVTVFNGLVIGGHINNLTVTNAPDASQMLNIFDNGVMHSLVLMPTGNSQLPNGTVSYVYDHNSTVGSPDFGDAQLAMSVNDGSNYTGGYDVELLSNSAAPGSGFDLAALSNTGSTPADIRNLLVEGNLVGSVQLPGTTLASVGIMGNAPAGSVQAASVQAVSFASITLTTSNGTVTIPAFLAAPWDAAHLLAPGTAIVQTNNTFLAAAGQTSEGWSQPVALFLDTGTSGAFDPHRVLLGNQGSIVGATNPVLAQVTAIDPPRTPSTIQSINLTGNGGSILTAQPITTAIWSSGALGDLILQSCQGIEASITAPSIFGNIAAPNGGISGIIQTTAGNIGHVLSGCDGSIIGATSILAGSGLTGTILSAGDLVSQISVFGGFRGTIAAGGNLGYLVASNGTILNRFGGMTVIGGFYGDAVFLGNIYGNIFILGGLNGRIAAQGAADGLAAGRQGILGNINILGSVDRNAAIVSGGEIGDAGTRTWAEFGETDLDVYGRYKGILAAVGQINYEIPGMHEFASIFTNVGSSGTSGEAINNVFSGQTADDLILSELAALVANLNALQVSNGNLIDP